jgi:hypothetical protein
MNPNFVEGDKASQCQCYYWENSSETPEWIYLEKISSYFAISQKAADRVIQQ